eukprot:TRINITY_DN1165_c0_g1_i1.p1 TRINITY_DN1165_c0_g1~~TRINITY_DN1165_c0_g1_i1.p1  ORF type:complete len:138 (+),score=60.65 TRINITY_DN1165_c0_g1_i1:3-416(+)
MSLRRFGKVVGFPLPKTEQEWALLYARHKIVLPNVTALKLEHSTKMKGNTGARHFKSYKLPPITHWNKQITFSEVKHGKDTPFTFMPSLIVTLKSGEEKSILIKDKKSHEILREVAALDPLAEVAPRPLQGDPFCHL